MKGGGRGGSRLFRERAVSNLVPDAILEKTARRCCQATLHGCHAPARIAEFRASGYLLFIETDTPPPSRSRSDGQHSSSQAARHLSKPAAPPPAAGFRVLQHSGLCRSFSRAGNSTASCYAAWGFAGFTTLMARTTIAPTRMPSTACRKDVAIQPTTAGMTAIVCCTTVAMCSMTCSGA